MDVHTSANSIWPAGLLCPLASYAQTQTTNNVIWSYGMNIQPLLPDFGNASVIVRGYLLNKVKQPGTRLVFLDGFDWIISYNPANIPTGGSSYWVYLENKIVGRPTNQTAFRHGGITTANTAFFDGHVESLTSEYLSNSNYYWTYWMAYY
jgi:prepilin-type processing-associated H-X9-DG protein